MQQLQQQVECFVLTRKSCPRIGEAAVEQVPAKHRSWVQALSSVGPITLTPGRRRTPPVVGGHGAIAGPPAVVVAGSPAVAFGRRVRQTNHAEQVLHGDDSRALKSPWIYVFSSVVRRNLLHLVFTERDRIRRVLRRYSAATMIAIDTDRYYVTREDRSSAHKRYLYYTIIIIIIITIMFTGTVLSVARRWYAHCSEYCQPKSWSKTGRLYYRKCIIIYYTIRCYIIGDNW